jgi:hypothetical protein
MNVLWHFFVRILIDFVNNTFGGNASKFSHDCTQQPITRTHNLTKQPYHE